MASILKLSFYLWNFRYNLHQGSLKSLSLFYSHSMTSPYFCHRNSYFICHLQCTRGKKANNISNRDFCHSQTNAIIVNTKFVVLNFHFFSFFLSLVALSRLLFLKCHFDWKWKMNWRLFILTTWIFFLCDVTCKIYCSYNRSYESIPSLSPHRFHHKSNLKWNLSKFVIFKEWKLKVSLEVLVTFHANVMIKP